MAELVEFKVADDDAEVVYVEVNGAPSEGLRPAGNRLVAGQAASTLSHALDGVVPAARTIIEQLKAIGDEVDEVQLEFGIKLNAELKAVIAGTSAEGHCQVSVKWSRR